jgi:hypothetical protein
LFPFIFQCPSKRTKNRSSKGNSLLPPAMDIFWE